MSHAIHQRGHWLTRFFDSIFPRPADERLIADSACNSDIGKRTENQDLCHCDDQNAIYLVVDGMGGHQGGALASQIAVETIPAAIANSLSSGHYESREVQAFLEDAVQRAYQEMKFVASRCENYKRMGCTLAIAAVINDRLLYANIGDARVYLFHDGKMKQLTKDESLVQELVDAGAIKQDQAPTHRWKHVVTNCLSAHGIKKLPRWSELKLHAGDEVLLTSDGLTDVVPDEVIERKLREASTPERTVRGLIDEALRREAQDNVSCVVTKLMPVAACCSTPIGPSTVDVSKMDDGSTVDQSMPRRRVFSN